MRSRVWISFRAIVLLSMLVVSLDAVAQKLPERGEVRRGNKSFLSDDFEGAAQHYGRAIEYSPEGFEAQINLGSALIKAEKFEEAEKLLTVLAADSLRVDKDRSESYYNLGNSQFAQQKLEEALESYKNAIRFDHTDQEAKYNYAYTKALLDQQDQNEDQQDQNQDQNGDGEQDQNQDQQDQNQDQEQNEDQQDQDQDQQDQNQDQQEQEQDQQQPQPDPNQISEQEQQQMLDAIQAQEDKTQEDLKEKAKGVVIPGAKNW